MGVIALYVWIVDTPYCKIEIFMQMHTNFHILEYCPRIVDHSLKENNSYLPWSDGSRWKMSPTPSVLQQPNTT